MQDDIATIFSHPTDLLALLDAQTLRIEQINHSFERHFLIPEAKAKGKTIYEAIRLNVKDGLVSQIAGTLHSCGYYCDVQSDTQRHFYYSLLHVAGHKKCLLRIERTDVERLLNESESRMAALARISLEGMLLIQNGKIENCNERLPKLFGYHSKEDVVGRSIEEFIPALEIERTLRVLSHSETSKMEILTRNRFEDRLVLEISATLIQYRGEPALAMFLYDITARRKAERAIDQRDIKFRQLLENSPYPLLILTSGRVRYVNQAAIDLLGANDEENILETNFMDYIAPGWRPETESDVALTLQGENVPYREINILSLAGEEVSVEMKLALTIYENQPSVQVSMNNISVRLQLRKEQMRASLAEEINTVLKREIQEHEVTQQKLLSAQRYTRSIIESSLDIIITCDKDNHIVEFNTAASREFGYTHAEIAGKPLRILYNNDETYAGIIQTLKNQGRFSGEVLNQRKDGSTFTALLSASIILAEDGTHMGSMGVSRDITPLRQKERQALEQNARLESIYNSTQNMMLWTLNRNMEITSMNRNFFKCFQIEYNETLQQGAEFISTLARHTNPDFHQGQINGFMRAFQGNAQHFELPLINSAGAAVWLEVFINPITLDGKLEEISCLAFDITDRKVIDRKVRDSLKEKEVLLQEVHHRVKNNLQVISSILNLQSAVVEDPRILQILEESQNRIASMSYIHETLYRTADFSAIEFAGYIKQLARNLVNTYNMQSTKVKLQTDFAEIHLSIDQAIPCGLIVNELVSNAMKHAFVGRKSGTIKVSLQQKNGTMELSVSDNGRGLPEGFQFEKSKSLGVQLVYTLAEQLDGKVTVESKAGTRFTITFVNQ